MKADFELNIDKEGCPCIKFKDDNKNKSLDNEVLKIFIKSANENGLCLKNLSGYIDSNGNSFENYEIQIK
jgi:hypothetical protein